jgi:hemerythrin-like metal-binding protein
METGNQLVDEQHQELVALFNEVMAAEQDASGPPRVFAALERLTEYVVVHFTAEEALMAESEYPAASVEVHVSEHRALTERTRELVLAYRTGELESAVPLVEFLRAWLTGHIEQSDRRLVEHVKATSN